MRITNMMTMQTFIKNMYRNTSNASKYGEQLAANRKILKMSDDPVNSLKAIKAGKDISAKKQYSENVEDAKSSLSQVETSLSQLGDIYKRLYELSGASSTDIFTQSQREAILAEVKGLKEEIISVGNTYYAGKYIFGGHNTSTTPFKDDGSGNVLYNGVNLVANGADVADVKDQKLQYEINKGIEFDIGFNGVDLMGVGSDNLINVIDNFIITMNDSTKTATDIAAYKSKFQDSLNNVLNMVTDVGGRQARLELTSNRFEEELINLETVRSDAEDIDQAEVITQYKMAQAIYELTLQVGARIIQPSLLDFLR